MELAISMENDLNLKAILQYQIDLGVDEAITANTFNRFKETKLQGQKKPERILSPKPIQSKQRNNSLLREQKSSSVDNTANEAKLVAQKLVSEVQTLDDLKNSIEAFNGCDYRETAINLVFADGNPKAKIMVIGEAPGQDEDKQGLPFVGRSGQLLDKIFSEAGLSRKSNDSSTAIYITNAVNWRPPGNKTPPPEVIDMFRPFIQKHIELVNPKILVLTGNSSCNAIINRGGIIGLRGKWIKDERYNIMPIVHPAFLLRNPKVKRDTWNDILKIKQKLLELS